MKEFLRQVARHYLDSDISGKLFVFANRRSEVFFRKYLMEELGACPSEKAFFMPRMTTISDLFSSLYAGRGVLADKITLLLELYEVYVRSYKGENVDTIDEFMFWGDVILGDFDDVDKYKADPKQIFTNISEIKDLEDDYSFLTPVQREAMERLVGSIRGKAGSDKKYHREFLKIWNILLPVYEDYNKTLENKGLAYEGMIFRQVAESLSGNGALDMIRKLWPDVEKVIFVGLNALTECEKVLLAALHKGGNAEFCWDYPSGSVKEWINDPLNKSSFFMKENVERFPQAFKTDSEEQLQLPEINVVTVASDVAQAKLVPNFINEIRCRTAGRPFHPDRTVVVLPDENLLATVLTSIPEEVEKLNITMGYPLSATQSFTLLEDVLSLFEVRRTGYFYHRPVWNILSSSLYLDTLSEEDIEKIKAIKAEARSYVKKESLDFLELFRLPDSADDLTGLCGYLRGLVDGIARKTSFQREQQALFEIYKCINHLDAKRLNVKFSTFRSLLLNLIGLVSLPFKGEPVEGLQIMGPLEIRSLDFENVIILSSAEGVFPRKSVSNSFIPYIIRKAFDLPTYEYQDAVWAYYFYRLIRRAERVWMVYDNVPQGLKSGEPSRYIQQLQYGFNAPITFWNATATAGVSYDYQQIDKKGLEEDFRKRLREHVFSASGLETYLQCPMMFYYKYIARLKEKDEVDEDPQANQLGNVVHETMQKLYEGHGEVTMSYLESLKKDRSLIRRVMEPIVLETFRIEEIQGKHLIAFRTAMMYVNAIIEEDMRLLKSKGLDSFKVYGLELKLSAKLGNHAIKGTIDRLDSYEDGTIRVVDYKTGEIQKDDVEPDGKTVEKIFNGVEKKGWPKIALQIWFYDYLLQNSNPQDSHYDGQAIINSIYCPYVLSKEGRKEAPMHPDFYLKCGERTLEVMEEIMNPEVKFTATPGKACSYCQFQSLCRK